MSSVESQDDQDDRDAEDYTAPVKVERTIKPAPKKKVGRPKKTILRRDIVHEGIVSVPCNLQSASDEKLVYSMRLLYENPGMFKNIFNLLKSMGSDRASIRFEQTQVKIFTTDSKGDSRIYIVIHGDKMNSYYCERTLDLEFSVENPRKKLQSLQREITEIELIATRKWEKEHFEIVLRNETTSMRNESRIKVDLPEIEDCWTEVEEDLAKEKRYPIKFEMMFKAFKQTVNNIFNHLGNAGKFTIEKTGLEELRFHFPYEDGLGHDNNTFEDAGKINLISTVEDGEPFAAPVYVERVKLLAGTLISDIISISVDEHDDLIFTMFLDQEEDDYKRLIPGTDSAYIKVLTKLAKSDEHD
jgi:intracellular sulfur oxidation DsrE/DsrF family protein